MRQRKFKPTPLFYLSFALMLTSSYLDNLRGPLLALLREVFSLSYSYASYVVVLGLVASVGAILSLGSLIDRFGQARVTVATCILLSIAGVLSFLCVSFEQSLVFFFVCGVCITIFGTLSNILLAASVPLKYLGKFYCLLHTMYGLASGLATLAVAALPFAYAWQISVLPAVATCFLLIYLSWRSPTLYQEAEAQTEEDKLAQSQPSDLAAGLIVCSFSLYVLAEVTASTWLPAYAASKNGVSVSEASIFAFGFFMSMGLSRLVLFLLPELNNKEGAILGVGFIGMSFFLLGMAADQVWLLALVGCVGPIFPLLMSIVRQRFAHFWRKLILRIITAVQIGLALNHFFVGRLADLWGIQVAYLVVGLYFTLWLLVTGLLFRCLRRL